MSDKFFLLHVKLHQDMKRHPQSKECTIAWCSRKAPAKYFPRYQWQFSWTFKRPYLFLVYTFSQ